MIMAEEPPGRPPSSGAAQTEAPPPPTTAMAEPAVPAAGERRAPPAHCRCLRRWRSCRRRSAARRRAPTPIRCRTRPSRCRRSPSPSLPAQSAVAKRGRADRRSCSAAARQAAPAMWRSLAGAVPLPRPRPVDARTAGDRTCRRSTATRSIERRYSIASPVAIRTGAKPSALNAARISSACAASRVSTVTSSRAPLAGTSRNNRR